MLATLVIFLREGVEASMIVAILLAYLNRIGKREYFRDVFLGVGAALILATAGGAVAYETIRSYDGSRVQTIFETITFVVAATVLTYMTFWMRNHARSLSKELRAHVDAALDGRARWGLGLLAFQAVGREGLETVVFTLAIIFSTSTAGALSGAAIGLAGALAIAFVIYRLGHRLNMARFFTVIGLLLMVFAAGLLADTIENLQQLGWLPVLATPMWHSASLLSEDSSFGDVLHSFFGYSDAPTPLQLVVYVGYLAIVISAFLRIRGRRTPAPAPVAPASELPGSGVPGPQLPASDVPGPQLPASGAPSPQLSAGGVSGPQLPAGGVPSPQLPAGGVSGPQLPAGGVPSPQLPAADDQPAVTATPARQRFSGAPALRPPPPG